MLSRQRHLIRSSLRAFTTPHTAWTPSITIIRPFHISTFQKTLHPSLTDRDPTHSTAETPETHNDRLFSYSNDHSTPLPPKFDHLHAHSLQVYPTTAGKTVSALQGQFQQMLMRLTKPKSVLELGTFMGYSAMAMADGMPKGGVIYTCEKDPKSARLSRELFEEHAYSPSTTGKEVKRKDATIEVVEGDGMATLAVLAKRNLRFDAVFLDADKGNYVNYYNFILDNDMLTDEGYILADNVLFSGLVLNSEQRKRDAAAASASSSSSSSSSSSASSSTTTAFSKGKGKKGKNGEAWGGDTFQKFADHIDTFNKHVRSDPRVDVVLLPAFDGLSLIMKKRQ